LNAVSGYPTSTSVSVYFGGKRVAVGGAAFVPDRLGSKGKYYPYGEERNSPLLANDQVKFATYTRDSVTGLDYADQRYYANNLGRFMTPDPYGANEEISDPASWNAYSYTEGDPVNYNDPTGELLCKDFAANINGKRVGTLGDVIRKKDDAGLLARVVFAEADNGAFNGFQTQDYFDEKTAVAVSIVNRIDILNYRILIIDGKGDYLDPGLLGWGKRNGSLTDVLNARGQYQSVSNGDITAAFSKSLDAALNSDAGSKECANLANDYQAAYYALGHVLVDPFGSNGVTTGFHHGTSTGSLEQLFGSFQSPNNFFGIPTARVVYNPSGTPPPKTYVPPSKRRRRPL
jgi:RHS repeat-associated protein